MQQICILLLLVGLSYAQPCPDGQVWCNGTDPIECIPEEYVCDYTFFDCSNDWDETDCPCRDDQWTCANGECIWMGQDCNGYDECQDKSDEMNCETCRVFQCDNGKCLNKYDICDGVNDCPNGEDEEPGCPKCDPRFLWTCADLSCCFKSSVCDGYPDCPDGSDEWDCTIEGGKISVNTSGVKREEQIWGSKEGSQSVMAAQAKHARRNITGDIKHGQPKAGIVSFINDSHPKSRKL